MQAEGRRVQSIYYGRIGSEVTEMLLARFGQDGSFLLRDSETVAGAYCLCVRLVPTNDGWFIQEPGGRQQIFRTLETLIEHYRRGLTSEVQVPPLTDPLDKTEIEYTSFGEDLLYMETCGSSDR
ncbi:SH2 domain-containing protein 1A-like isoform X2 [Takifugu flavidus]|uniref:SH2 domain-containing protein 1A-like isoform X2 n=1 Tax=Takifugu flavidus TaxID=433684 RepID=UPI0025445BF1|nr:SH2 domain-containing protein 1A-like isoform X2 [Takifugu flavidus]